MANYPTQSYANLKNRFMSIAGLSSLETIDGTFLRENVNKRIKTAYGRYPWPNFVVVGELEAFTTGDANVKRIYGTTNTLAFNADTIFRIHKTDPATTRYPEEYCFVSMLDSGGYPAIKVVEPAALNSVNGYFTYRKHITVVVADGGTYTSGYWGDEATDNPNVPYDFFEYSVVGSYADFLRGDGQNEKAQLEEQNSESILRSEIDRVRNQGRQYRHDILQYRPTTQFRRHNVVAGGSAIDQTGQSLDNNA